MVIFKQNYFIHWGLRLLKPVPDLYGTSSGHSPSVVIQSKTFEKVFLCSFADAESRRRRSLRKVGIPVNIAVIGITGVGKSSFINAIRGLTADDEGAAAVGVTETTTKIAPYTHPDNPNLKLWDLPGVGTDDFPQAQYLRLISVDRYDFFVVISATRFFEVDTWLVKELAKRGKKFVFVRTKVDLDVKNNRRSHPRSHSEEAVVKNILASTREHLNHTGQTSAELFLIDSYARHKYDFTLLSDKLLYEVPESKTLIESTRSRCVII